MVDENYENHGRQNNDDAKHSIRTHTGRIVADEGTDGVRGRRAAEFPQLFFGSSLPGQLMNLMKVEYTGAVQH